MPRLWNDTIETHRRAVREAVLETTAALVHARGLKAVTMSQIAEQSGIGRATLYKYFPDVGAILVAWHEQKIAEHLEQLVKIRDRTTGASARLEAVLLGYAFMSSGRHGTELSALLHQGEHVAKGHERLRQLVAELIEAGAAAGELRRDVAADELAGYCLHAVAAAATLPSAAAVHRLVGVIVSGLKAQR